MFCVSLFGSFHSFHGGVPDPSYFAFSDSSVCVTRSPFPKLRRFPWNSETFSGIPMVMYRHTPWSFHGCLNVIRNRMPWQIRSGLCWICSCCQRRTFSSRTSSADNRECSAPCLFSRSPVLASLSHWSRYLTACAPWQCHSCVVHGCTSRCSTWSAPSRRSRTRARARSPWARSHAESTASGPSVLVWFFAPSRLGSSFPSGPPESRSPSSARPRWSFGRGTKLEEGEKHRMLMLGGRPFIIQET